MEAARLNARLIASELYDLGITVNCAPVLDVPQPDADPIISDRAAGDTPERAAMLGLAACEGFLDGGVLPVIKHIPGHGRAVVDSHLSLPKVTASREELDHIDFAPFRALSDMPWAMTAHVLFQAIDPEAPATTSPTVIRDIIRKAIGFDGLLISDDLSMEALDGNLGKRTRDTLAAGCDVALHCNGKMAEMADVANACDTMSDAAWTRLVRGEAARRLPVPMDITAEKARLDDFLKDLQ